MENVYMNKGLLNPLSTRTLGMKQIPACCLALTALVTGKTISQAAGEASVHRNTVHRWLNPVVRVVVTVN